VSVVRLPTKEGMFAFAQNVVEFPHPRVSLTQVRYDYEVHKATRARREHFASTHLYFHVILLQRKAVFSFGH
jgi:hypothetical protein